MKKNKQKQDINVKEYLSYVTNIFDAKKNIYESSEREKFIKGLDYLLSTSQFKLEIQNKLQNYIHAISDFYKSNIATFILAIFEKYFSEKETQELAINIINHDKKKSRSALGVLLRIAKKNNNYLNIDTLFEKEPSLKKIDTFEILYELIFYYNYKNDINNIEQNIGLIIQNFSSSRPILQSAKSLAIRFGFYEKYEQKLVEALSHTVTKNIQEDIFLKEQDILLNSYEQALASAALADLTKGIAHEFGQPLTNIRYNIQYHTNYKFVDKDCIDKKIVIDCFNDIIKQTERIGYLIDSLSPFTSQKKNITQLDFKKTLEEIFEAEKNRLTQLKIKFFIKTVPNTPISIKFDKNQFVQIFNNLLVNAIDSIEDNYKENKSENYSGYINVSAKEFDTYYSIYFNDNGKGFPNIALKDRIQIFNPFYTTKSPGKGQGLGLYIVSNLLKMNHSHIKLNTAYIKGAKFEITISKQKNYDL
jgi:signal transduction histidine kinase